MCPAGGALCEDAALRRLPDCTHRLSHTRQAPALAASAVPSKKQKPDVVSEECLMSGAPLRRRVAATPAIFAAQHKHADAAAARRTGADAAAADGCVWRLQDHQRPGKWDGARGSTQRSLATTRAARSQSPLCHLQAITDPERATTMYTAMAATTEALFGIELPKMAQVCARCCWLLQNVAVGGAVCAHHPFSLTAALATTTLAADAYGG